MERLVVDWHALSRSRDFPGHPCRVEAYCDKGEHRSTKNICGAHLSLKSVSCWFEAALSIWALATQPTLCALWLCGCVQGHDVNQLVPYTLFSQPFPSCHDAHRWAAGRKAWPFHHEGTSHLASSKLAAGFVSTIERWSRDTGRDAWVSTDTLQEPRGRGADRRLRLIQRTEERIVARAHER